MNEKFFILGDENKINYYNLNKQYSNIKKIIVTSEKLLENFENADLKNLVERLKSTSKREYFNILGQAKEDKVFENKLNNNINSQLKDLLLKISQNLMNVNIKEYSFLQDLTNLKLTVTLRTDKFSMSEFYVEKDFLQATILKLLESYLFNDLNLFRLNNLDRFQIEIYETIEVTKSFYLLKNKSRVFLYVTEGFNHNKPFDYNVGGEIYISNNDKFKFFGNTQEFVLEREHTKIVEKKLRQREKILSTSLLKKLHNETKDMDELLIEGFFDLKDKIYLENISLFEKDISNFSEKGILLYKSSKNYNKISVVSMNENLDEKDINPIYLTLNKIVDFKVLFENLNLLKNYDGLIFTKNFYAPIIEQIGKSYDLDILIYNENLSKSLESELDLENVLIKQNLSDEVKNEESNQNPFENIIKNTLTEQEKKELKEKMEREKIKQELEMSVKNQERMKEEKKDNFQKEIEDFTMRLFSHQNSSLKKGGGETISNRETRNDFSNSVKSENVNQNNSESQPKKNTIQMLAENLTKPSIEKTYNENEKRTDEDLVKEVEKDLSESNAERKDLMNEILENKKEEESYVEVLDRNENKKEEVMPTLEDLDKELILKEMKDYLSVLKTKVITLPKIENSSNFFVDNNTIKDVNGGNLYLLVDSIPEIKNSSMNYIFNFENVNFENLKNEVNSLLNKIDFILFNKLESFFYLESFKDLMKENFNKLNFFFNITKINNDIKENFMKSLFDKLQTVSLIVNKSDLNLIKNDLDKIKNLIVVDLENNDEFNEFKEKVLSFEKDLLIKKIEFL